MKKIYYGDIVDAVEELSKIMSIDGIIKTRRQIKEDHEV